MKVLQALKVLLVEDNQGDVLLLRAALDADQLSTFELTTVDLLEDGLQLLQQAHFDIALVDLGLPDSLGLETFERIHRANPKMPVVIFSGNEDEEQAVEAVRLGAQDYLVKSLSGFDMAARTIRYAIERQHSQQQLRESEENYKTLFDSNPHPMWVFDLETLGFLTVNEAAIRHYGYSREEFLSMNLLDIRPAEDHQPLMETLADVDEGLHKAGYWRHIKKDGSLIDVEITSHTLEYYGRKAEIVLANDITERKQTEDALKESEARFSKLFFTNPISQSILSAVTGQVVEVNDACCSLYEYSREELIGTDPGSLDLWANPADQLDVLEELQKTGHLLPREITIRPKSGEVHTILFSVEQIAWKGEPCLISSSVDISERKLAEFKIQEQLQRLKSLHIIDQAINTNSIIQETLNVILQQTKELLGVDAAAILLLDEQKQMLECTASQGFKSQGVHNAQLKLSE